MKGLDKTLKRKAILTACALALGMSWSVAHSVPVTTWSYTTIAEFSDPEWSAGISTYTTAQGNLLAWGGPLAYDSPVTGPGVGTPDPWWLNNKSALTLGSFAANPETLVGLPLPPGGAEGSVDTLLPGGVLDTDTIAKTVSLTHWNNPIHTQWESLLGATISVSTTLTPQAPPGGDPQAGETLTFVYKFKETPNAGTNGLCEDGESASLVHNWNSTTSTGGCPDIFAYQALQVVDRVFDYQGFRYFVSLLSLNDDGTVNEIGIPKLLDAQCLAVGLNPGCFGFVTAEGQATTVRFGFAISARPLQQVPEPASIALIGLGLAALGMMVVRRRRGTATH